MKFLQTADWQIGMKAESVGNASQRVRDERLEAGKRVVEAARENAAEFILVAGDLFEDNAVDRSLIQKVADVLAAFEGPVYIIPGNHDPLVPGSVWDHPAWQRRENLVVLKEEKPVALEGGGFLYPCPLFEKYSDKNPTAWINAEGGEGIHIGLAHGTVEGVQQDELDYPIPKDAALRAGLDYLALGHWHSTALYPSEDGAVRMAYSGTHETSKFGERDSGNALLVDVTAPGAKPQITSLPTGGLRWQIIERDSHAEGDIARLREQVEALEQPESTLLSIELQGLLFASEQAELAHIRDILASRFLFGRLNAEELLPSPTDDSWISGLPTGIVRETAGRLMNMANEGGGATEESATVAARALVELYAIAQEAGR